MPTAHHLTIDLATDELGRMVLVVRGHVDLTTAPELRREIERVAQPGQVLVVDLNAVTFIDSPGLGTLIHCDRVRRERGGRLVLRNPSGPVRDLFEVVRLADVLEIE